MASIFSHIIAGEIPCHKVAEDADNFAFMDINPVARGHVLCVPKAEVDYIFDLPAREYASLMAFTRRVARGLRQAVPCVKVGEAVLGLEVPHAHVHLIPMATEADLDFRRPKLSMTPDELAALAAEIAAAVEATPAE